MAGTLLREDAAWIWFQDPRAVRSGDVTYPTWAATNGVFVGAYNHTTGVLQAFQLRDSPNIDDHNVAAVGIRPDGRLLAAYSDHNDSTMRVRISTNPGDVTAWGSEITAATATVTYPNLVYLASEATWYLFFRNKISATDWRVAYVTSTDDGATWSALGNLTAANPDITYLKVASNGTDKIHLAVTDGHPETNPTSIYHVWYDGGVWRDSAGADLGSPPIAHSAMTKIWDGLNDTNSWIWDITLDQTDPVVVFATFPSVNDHRYQYGRLAGGVWDIHQVTPAGASIETSGADPYYSGGIVVDPADPDIVYLSRQVGTGKWDVEQWSTGDGGATWTAQTIDSGRKSMRPVAVRGGPRAVLWFAGTYTSFSMFDTDMYWALAPEIPSPPSAEPGLPQVATPTIRTEVTWLGCDLVSGQIIAELPDITGAVSRLIGAYTSSQLSIPIPLGGPAHIPLTAVLQAIDPARTMAVAVVNDIPTWAGIPLMDDGGTEAILDDALVSLEGYLLHRYVRDHDWVDQDIVSVIAAGLLADAEAAINGVGGGIGLVMDAPPSGILRERHYKATDHQTVYQRLQELMTVQDGPEWTIDVDWTDATHTAVAKIARVRPRLGIAAAAPQAVFQATAGSVLSSQGSSEAHYRYIRDRSDGRYANAVQAYSSGEGEDQPVSTFHLDTAALAAGAPIWELHFQPSTSISDTAVLDDHAAEKLSLLQDGTNTWRVTARWSTYPRYGVDWQLGDDIAWDLRGHRHPARVQNVGRAIGFELDMQAGTITPILQEEAT